MFYWCHSCLGITVAAIPVSDTSDPCHHVVAPQSVAQVPLLPLLLLCTVTWLPHCCCSHSLAILTPLSRYPNAAIAPTLSPAPTNNMYPLAATLPAISLSQYHCHYPNTALQDVLLWHYLPECPIPPRTGQVHQENSSGLKVYYYMLLKASLSVLMIVVSRSFYLPLSSRHLRKLQGASNTL
jgi:hypothetical protein